MNAYWGPGVADYRIRQTATRLSVRQGNTGRRVVSLIFVVMGGGTLALGVGIFDTDEPMSRVQRMVALGIGAAMLALGA